MILYYSNQGGTAGNLRLSLFKDRRFLFVYKCFPSSCSDGISREEYVAMKLFAAHKSGKFRNNDFDKAREKYWRWSLRL